MVKASKTLTIPLPNHCAAMLSASLVWTCVVDWLMMSWPTEGSAKLFFTPNDDETWYRARQATHLSFKWMLALWLVCGFKEVWRFGECLTECDTTLFSKPFHLFISRCTLSNGQKLRLPATDPESICSTLCTVLWEANPEEEGCHQAASKIR